ncbi:MAG: transposase [Methylococcales bacterium]
MTNYRRIYTPGASWFFTVNLLKRQNNPLLIENIKVLRSAFSEVKAKHPFRIDAVVILPDHLHCIWTLPEGDTNYSTRWNLLKGKFSRSLAKGEQLSNSRIKRRERGIWQRRFWEHMLRNEEDFNRHLDYIHWNPVKHGYVSNVMDWPHSSFHKYVKMGWHPKNWGSQVEFDFETGE